jgi:hypothetical protein
MFTFYGMRNQWRALRKAITNKIYISERCGLKQAENELKEYKRQAPIRVLTKV